MSKCFKISMVFSIFASLLLIDACIGVDCDCPPLEKPYFDYRNLQLNEQETAINATYSKLKIEITPDSIDFVAFQEPSFNFNLGLINKAYGCSCLDEGGQGEKYAISSINIYCDKNINSSILSGENLSYLFETKINNTQGTPTAIALNEVSNFPKLYNYGEGIFIEMTTAPDSIGGDWLYNFTIEIVKENGETVSGETEAISWY